MNEMWILERKKRNDIRQWTKKLYQIGKVQISEKNTMIKYKEWISRMLWNIVNKNIRKDW